MINKFIYTTVSFWTSGKYVSEVFKREEALTFEYVPEKFVHREGQLREISDSVRPIFTGRRPFNCLCIGPTSTGKTGGVKFLFKRIAEEEVGEVKTAYVNCFFHPSPSQLLSEVVRSITGRRPPKASREKYLSVIGEWAKDIGVILALDEVDALLRTKNGEEILYNFLRFNEFEEEAKIGTICIMNEATAPKDLDPRLRSYMGREIYFPPYELEEITEILRNRAREAFLPGKIEDEAIKLASHYSYSENRDVRVGLEILRRAGIIAENRGKERVGTREIKEAFKEAKYISMKILLHSLDEEERTLLRKIAESEEGISTPELYELFSEEVSRTPQHFRKLLQRLEWYRLVELRPLPGSTRAREVYLRFPKEKVKEYLDML